MSPALQKIQEDYAECDKCPNLVQSRKNILIGEGNPSADLMVVTSSPNDVEDFRGMLGYGDDTSWLLSIYLTISRHNKVSEMAEKAQLRYFEPDYRVLRKSFFEEIYFTSAVACRPALLMGEGKGKDRDPANEEIQNCSDRLMRLIYAVDPIIILACGTPAITALERKKGRAKTKNGKLDTVFHINVPGVLTENVTYPVLPIHKIATARRHGDYEDPLGSTMTFYTALESAYDVAGLIREDR